MENSMINPPIVDLLEKVDNKYSLVVVTSKRARQLIDGADRLVEINSNKPLTVSINEVNSNRITYKTIKEGIK